MLMHPRAELLAPLRDAGPARGRDRGAEREQPLAEQRRDADPRAGAARRRRRRWPRRGALRPRRARAATAAARRCSPSTSTRRTRPPASASPTPPPATRSTSTGSTCRAPTRWCTSPVTPARATTCCTRSTRRSSDEHDPVACDPDARPLRPAQRVRGATRTSRATPPSSSTATAPRNGARRAHRRDAHAPRSTRRPRRAPAWRETGDDRRPPRRRSRPTS